MNGAVDFTGEYSLDGRDVYADVADVLLAAVSRRAASHAVTGLATPEPSLGLGGVA